MIDEHNLKFHQLRKKFLAGELLPSQYLSHCEETILAKEPNVRAWVTLRLEAARNDAVESDRRYREGRPLSKLDGMPIGIKDLIKTSDLPTYEGLPPEHRQGTYDDAPTVQALRKAGAIILGKTTTTELAGGDPPPTKNPFDLARTPGGSSSGSAAAVGAGMIPVAIGTQVAGSILRPSGFCSTFGFKPSFGMINRGDDSYYSHSCVGFHAGDLIDMWETFDAVAVLAGGDPGFAGWETSKEAPIPLQPTCIISVEGTGWSQTEASAQNAYEQALSRFSKAGVKIKDRSNTKIVEDFENALSSSFETTLSILAYEARWYFENLADKGVPLSPYTLATLERGRATSARDYRLALEQRAHMRASFEALRCEADLFSSLTNTGPAPLLHGQTVVPGMSNVATGNPAFNLPPSLLGAPALTLPVLMVGGLPIGLQLFSFHARDEHAFGYARWSLDNLGTISV